MKRRLKNEVVNKKKIKNLEQDSEEAAKFEESLLKLAQFTKGRIKLSDFTPQDKQSLLDLFVNNEKTLLKIYEALFPHNTTHLTQNDHNTSYQSNEYMSISVLPETERHVKLLDDQHYISNLKKNMQLLEKYELSSRNQSISDNNLNLSADRITNSNGNSPLYL